MNGDMVEVAAEQVVLEGEVMPLVVKAGSVERLALAVGENGNASET